MTDLPIEEIRSGVFGALEKSNRLIVEAPTGSGKSTRIPRMIAEYLDREKGGQVVVLQPRRIAARLLAARVAEEWGVRLGEEVGYQVRLESVASRRTQILFVTEGILLRRMLAQPGLPGVGAVVLDEFHERHLYGDICLSRCLDLQDGARPDLKVAVMSATLDGDSLGRFLGLSAVRLRSDGRMHPVETVYLPRAQPDLPVWEVVGRAVAGEIDSTQGNILVFLPGAYEIQRTVRELQNTLGGGILVLPLHGEMSSADQDRAVGRSETRKVIVSTNVAETSLTIPDVTCVVDSGLARIARFDADRGINTLHIEKISVAAADQRAGRAGRTMPGRCVRLWTIHEHAKRAARETPEILRMDLSEVLLQLAAFGVRDFSSFRWFEHPDASAVEKAALLLRDLGALDGDGSVTEQGRAMLRYPAHPRYSRMFLEAETLGCGADISLVAALTQTRNILLRADRVTEERREDLFGGSESDFVFLLRAFRHAKNNRFQTQACRELGIHADACRQADRLAVQFHDIVGTEPARQERFFDMPREEKIARCVLAGFADQVAKRRSAGNYLCDLVHGRRGKIPSSSQAGGAWLVVAAEVREIGRSSGEVSVELGLLTAIEEAWLRELFPSDFTSTVSVRWEESQKRVVEVFEKKFRDLVIESRTRDANPGDAATECLVGEILQGNIVLPDWESEAVSATARINFLARAMPELRLPPIGDEDLPLLLSRYCEGATCLRDLRDRSATPVVYSWLRSDQRSQLESLAPAKVQLPGGRNARVEYSPDGSAKISVKIQDLFGLNTTPKVAAGRISVTVEILAPNNRPVQVTRDLQGFWSKTYPELKPALSRRYPKHRWD